MIFWPQLDFGNGSEEPSEKHLGILWRKPDMILSGIPPEISPRIPLEISSRNLLVKYLQGFSSDASRKVPRNFSKNFPTDSSSDSYRNFPIDSCMDFSRYSTKWSSRNSFRKISMKSYWNFFKESFSNPSNVVPSNYHRDSSEMNFRLKPGCKTDTDMV